MLRQIGSDTKKRKTQDETGQIKEPAASRKGSGKRIFYLDLIRVLSMFLIVIYHFPLSIYIRGVDVLHSTANGRWGVAVVYVFFMISGAALFYRYRDKNGFNTTAYYKRRISSIYPLFYIAYVLGFMYVFWVRGSMYSYVPLSAFVWTLLGLDGYLNNIVPTFTMVGEWFLGSIIIVYALFPPLYKAVSRPASDFKDTEENPMSLGRTAAVLLFLGIGTLYVFSFHPFPFIEIKANPVVDLFFFLSGGAAGCFFGKKLAARPMPAALALSGALLIIWIFIRLPFEPLLRTEGLLLSLTDGIFAVLIFIFLMTASVYVQRIAPMKRLIVRAAPYTYGVFLIHHLVEARICAHFDPAVLGRRDVVFLLILCLLAVAAFTLLLYKLKEILVRMFS